jgi:hypothetical protein
MDDVPAGKVAPRAGRRAVAFLLSAACAILGACGGADGGSAAPAAVPVPAPVAAQQGSPPPGLAMMGRTSVVMNPMPAQAPPTAGAPQSAVPGPDDPGRIVAVVRDPDGTVRLQQRDGAVREVAPDGTMARGPGAAGALQGDLPPSLIVAVDSANTVHLVDPDACAARTIAPDGRVATTSLPSSRTDRTCNPFMRGR